MDLALSPPCAVAHDSLRALRLGVRNSKVADAATLVSLHNEGLERPGEMIAEEAAAHWIVAHHRAARPLWLAMSRGVPIGWLSFLGFADRPGCATTAELGILVRASWRRHGVARQLVERAFVAAPALGLDRLIACIREDNGPSLALFRSMGFQSWGRLPGVIRAPDVHCDLHMLGREIPAPKLWYV
ncbi:GNAT family N-acetyltransferase [Aquincola sp. S2]|uniref:GNAT family N-acetyltransferase n=1 Tax=Pseudaquabacterium terrae TaxID=2732868 RepID=A0ABX2EIL9_9BURK|nr:GNAT family N-acetyltransferase [Aquabacterium terrae]NRF68492.1 GNAT family N-acetyltransferase [Aquabacterium terrae]